MTAPIKSSTPAATTATTAKSEKPAMTESERKSTWDGALSEKLSGIRSPKDGSTPLLSDWRADRMEGKIAEDMKEWMADPANKDADAGKIQAAAEDAYSKRYGYEFTTKMMDDNFMSNLMRRSKELMADLWS